jgi:hypothetical protein
MIDRSPDTETAHGETGTQCAPDAMVSDTGNKTPDCSRDRDAMLVEVICERAHCVIYEYAIVTVKFVADEFKGRIRVKPVVRRGSKKNVDRYLELCRINGQPLSVPAIIMGGKLAFTYVPGIEDLRNAMVENLNAWENRPGCESARPNG